MRALVCADSRGALSCREQFIYLEQPMLLAELLRQLESDLRVDLLPETPGYWFILLLNEEIVSSDAQVLVRNEDTLSVYPGPLAGG
jgi:hypothetical protein